MQLEVITPNAQCPLQMGGYCEYIADLFGRLERLTANRCGQCKRNGGPFEGREIVSDKFIRDLYTAITKGRDAETTLSLIRKHNCNKGLKVSVPQAWESIRKHFAHMSRFESIREVCVTGSLMYEGLAKNDYDIVLVIDDLREFVQEKNMLKATLPKQIDGVSVDYFFHYGITPLHARLNCDARKYYHTRTTIIKPVEFIDVEAVELENDPLIETMTRELIADMRGNRRPISLPLFDEIKTRVSAHRAKCDDCDAMVQFKSFDGSQFESHVICEKCKCPIHAVDLNAGKCPERLW